MYLSEESKTLLQAYKKAKEEFNQLEHISFEFCTSCIDSTPIEWLYEKFSDYDNQRGKKKEEVLKEYYEKFKDLPEKKNDYDIDTNLEHIYLFFMREYDKAEAINDYLSWLIFKAERNNFADR